MGEVVHAYVVRRPDATVTGAELATMVGEQLNDMWQPRTVDFLDALPLTRANKVDKKALRARWAAEHPEPSLSATAITAAATAAGPAGIGSAG